MNPILRNIIAVIIGIIVGMLVNMSLIMISGSIIPLPEGVDPNDMESMKSNMHLYEAKHFIFPFLAHALGTFVGALLAALIAANHKMKFAIAIGILFLVGGIIMIFSVPSPTWFTIVDLVLAYIPMAWIGAKLVGSSSKK